MSFDTYPVAGEPDPTADAVAILASEFHEGWRGDFAQPDGSFTSRIKVYAELPDGTCKWYNEADVPADATEHKRQDIANTAYHELDPDWQAENKAAAEVVVALLAEAAGPNRPGTPLVRWWPDSRRLAGAQRPCPRRRAGRAI